VSRGFSCHEHCYLDDLQIKAASLKTILNAAGFNVYTSSLATMTRLPVEDGSFDIAILDLSVDAAEALQIGKIIFNEDRLAPVFTAYSGRISELLANREEIA